MEKRVFAAIELSSEARRGISAYIESLRIQFRHVRVGWVHEEKLHLTLKFFGRVDSAMIGDLITATDIVASTASPFKLKISGTGVFPNKKEARILWIGLHDQDGRLPAMNEAYEIECAKLGFKSEKRRFKPHLTIARLREPERASELATAHLSNNFEPVASNATSITLIESSLLATGSVYRPIHRSEFRQP